jgi:hypothetical protein
MRPRRSTTLIALLAVALSAAFALRAPASAEAGTCTHRTGVNHVNWLGKRFTQDWVCGNKAGASLYAQGDIGWVTGWMDSRRSWFVCWTRGDMHHGGNRIWYYTQGDRAAGGDMAAFRGWGYMPAGNVYTNVDPWPGMPNCYP